jgi:hypothetical protein
MVTTPVKWSGFLCLKMELKYGNIESSDVYVAEIEEK